MRLAIVGSRKFKPKKPITQMLLNLGLRIIEDVALLNYEKPEKTIQCLISGLAEGADELAIDLALERKIPYLGYVPEWETYGKKAGILRNGYIVGDCDAALVLWDGKSRGTEDTIKKLWASYKPHVIVRGDTGNVTVDIVHLDKFVELRNDIKQRVGGKSNKHAGATRRRVKEGATKTAQKQ